MVNKKLATISWSTMDKNVSKKTHRGKAKSDSLILINIQSGVRAAKDTEYKTIEFKLNDRLLEQTKARKFHGGPGIEPGCCLELRCEDAGMFLVPNPEGRRLSPPTKCGKRAVVRFTIANQYAKMFEGASATHVEATPEGIAFELTYQ